jgi:hypothetical protein
MEDKEPKTVPIASLIVEDGAQELVRSEKMKPYLALLRAQMSGQDPTLFFEALAALPLEERYVWRVTSALKWAFCDLETESLIADLRTLSVADLKRLVDPLQIRTIQFSIFILTMLGSEAGEKLILHALNSAKASLETGSSE